MNQKYSVQKILSTKVWLKNKLFSISVTKPSEFNFISGEFTRLGLPCEPENSDCSIQETIWRPYSMVSSSEDNMFEFYSILVPSGKFSTKLSNLKPGDSIYIENRTYGFFTLERLKKNKIIWLIASGTGLSAYLSMLRSKNIWVSYDLIIVVHSVRCYKELAYQDELNQLLIKKQNASKFIYYPLCTYANKNNRITQLIINGSLEKEIGNDLCPDVSNIMICGNPNLIIDVRKILGAKGFYTSKRENKGNLSVENYW